MRVIVGLALMIALGGALAEDIPGVEGDKKNLRKKKDSSPTLREPGRKIKFKRKCSVYTTPDTSSPVVCEKDKGEKLIASSRAVGRDRKFYRVLSRGCLGYVPRKCVLVAKRKSKRNTAGVSESEIKPVKRKGWPTRLGLVAKFDGITARVDYSTTHSKGLGYSFGLRLVKPLNNIVRGSVGVGYQFYRLSRDFSLSGATIAGTSSTTVQQRINYLSATILLGFKIVDGDRGKRQMRRLGFTRKASASKREPSWWLEGGLEGLFPLSASQVGATTISGDIPVSDRPLLAVGGLSVTFPTSGRIGFEAEGHIVFNLSGDNGSRFYGARLGAAVQLKL